MAFSGLHDRINRTRVRASEEAVYVAAVKRCPSSDAKRTFSLLLLIMQGRRTDSEEMRRMGINL